MIIEHNSIWQHIENQRLVSVVKTTIQNGSKCVVVDRIDSDGVLLYTAVIPVDRLRDEYVMISEMVKAS